MSDHDTHEARYVNFPFPKRWYILGTHATCNQIKTKYFSKNTEGAQPNEKLFDKRYDETPSSSIYVIM